MRKQEKEKLANKLIAGLSVSTFLQLEKKDRLHKSRLQENLILIKQRFIQWAKANGLKCPSVLSETVLPLRISSFTIFH
ncbi:hypothetical protein WN944_013686 [Citrus x changshan-huyou]|uniref:Uncharacterized protein n=1 Tax=Citrus x changshan-huyou TaxID=2935761 RepID=A0AAP0QK19_9ROSI